MDRIFMHCSIKVKKKLAFFLVLILIFTGMPEGTLFNVQASSLPTPILFLYHFTFNQIFDVQRSPAYPTVGSDFKVSSFKAMYSSEKGASLSGSASSYSSGYFAFSWADDATATDARVKLAYYNADGTLSEVISSWGYMYGLFDSGFFYEGKGHYGYIATFSQYSYGSSLDMGVATHGIIQNTSDLQSYTPTSVVAAVSKYTVTFDANTTDSVTVPSSVTIVSGSNISAYIPSRTGYSFNGWNTSSNGTGTAVAAGGTITLTADTTLFAQWSPITYTIALNNMNASSSGTSAIYEKYNTAFYLVNGASAMSYAANPITVPAKTGYVFGGYYTATDYSTQIIQPGGYITNSIANTYFTASTTLFAKWNPEIYSIYLDNEGAGTAGSQYIYEKYSTGFYLDASASGYSMTGSSNCITVPAKNGYTFAGYYTAVNGGGTQAVNSNGYINAYFSTSNYTANSTLYAKWDIIDYTLTFSNEGAISSVTAHYGFALPLSVTLSKNNYTFNGYFTMAGGNGIKLYGADKNLCRPVNGITDANGAWLRLENLTVYSFWTPDIYVISLDNQSATSDDDTKKIYLKFDTGFYLDASASASLMGGTVNGITVPLRTGYSFLGYYDAKSGGNKIIDSQGFIVTSIADNAFTGNTTLYARWSPNTYKIVLDNVQADNTGTQVIYEKYDNGFYLNQACTARYLLNGTSARKISIPTKTGFDFKGYFDDDAANEIPIITADGCINSENTGNSYFDTNDITLYAHWSVKTARYTVSFVPNGAKGSMQDQTISCTESAKLNKCEFTREGYTFEGWSYSSSSKTAAFEDEAVVTGLSGIDGATVKLYAVWKNNDINSYPYYIENGSFEAPSFSGTFWTNTVIDTTPGLSWLTSSPNRLVEIANVEYSASSCYSSYNTWNATDGVQFAELNATSVGALYQMVSTADSSKMYWGFDHKGRYGSDTMELWIGAPYDVNSLLSYYKDHGNSISALSTDTENAALYEKYLSIRQESAKDGNTNWNTYSGIYTVPETQDVTMFAFVATETSDGSLTSGNIIDNVYFTPTKPVLSYGITITSTDGGTVGILKEGVSEGEDNNVSYGKSYSGTLLTDQLIELVPNPADGYSYNGAFIDGTYYTAKELECSQGSIALRAGSDDTSELSAGFKNAKSVDVIFSKTDTINFGTHGGTYADSDIDLKDKYNKDKNYEYVLGTSSIAGYRFVGWQVVGSDVILPAGTKVIRCRYLNM